MCVTVQEMLITSRKMIRARYIGRTEKRRNPYKILVEIPKGNKPFRSTWKCSIEINLKETRHEGVEWIHLAQDITK
jgi:hypothetical protein